MNGQVDRIQVGHAKPWKTRWAAASGTVRHFLCLGAHTLGVQITGRWGHPRVRCPVPYGVQVREVFELFLRLGVFGHLLPDSSDMALLSPWAHMFLMCSGK